MQDDINKTAAPTPDLRGHVPESWHCVDCGFNTAPGFLDRAGMQAAYRTSKTAIYAKGKTVAEQTIDDRSEVFHVRDKVWKRAGMGPQSGCLCVGCLETRIGRRLKPEDFPRSDPLNMTPGTPRLLQRRGNRR